MRILMYHEVVEGEPSEIHAVSRRGFAEQMGWLHTAGVRIVALEDCLRGVVLPGNAVAISFDDGYRDNYTAAWPVLQEYGFPATIFLVTDCVGATSRWRRGHLARAAMLYWTEAREMARASVSFGAHTVTHPRLPSLDSRAAKEELCESRDRIEQELGGEVVSMAYQYHLEKGINFIRALLRTADNDDRLLGSPGDTGLDYCKVGVGPSIPFLYRPGSGLKLLFAIYSKKLFLLKLF